MLLGNESYVVAEHKFEDCYICIFTCNSQCNKQVLYPVFKVTVILSEGGKICICAVVQRSMLALLN